MINNLTRVGTDESTREDGLFVGITRTGGARGVACPPGCGTATNGDDETVLGPKGEMRQGLRNRLIDSGPARTESRS